MRMVTQRGMGPISFLAIAVLLLTTTQAHADEEGLGHQVAGTWLRETATAQMLVNIASDGSWLTAASTVSEGPVILSPGVGSWSQSGPNQISLAHLQFIYLPTGEHFRTSRMTGEVVFGDREQGRFQSATATFSIEIFFPGQDIDPGSGIFAGFFENFFHRAP
jgi:hypothetical protein